MAGSLSLLDQVRWLTRDLCSIRFAGSLTKVAQSALKALSISDQSGGLAHSSLLLDHLL
jgi:hypothetical protein